MLPMGIKPATDIFQQCIGSLFFYMPVVVVYMDDTIVFGYANFGTHLIDVTEVLRRLQAAGMQVNPDKCLWFQPEVMYFGFLITGKGIKPQPDKIQGILNMKRLTMQKDINFYHNLYPKQADSSDAALIKRRLCIDWRRGRTNNSHTPYYHDRELLWY
jgi:hypothetical protein